MMGGEEKLQILETLVEELLKEQEMLLAEGNINHLMITKLLTKKNANTEILAKQ